MRRTLTRGPVGLGLITLVCAFMLAPAAVAQDTGAIGGQVTDTTGGALPGVTVEVSSPALIGGAQVAFTDGEGRYLVTTLPAGAFSITFTLPGFSTVVRDGVDIGAGFTANIGIEMSVGAVEETITVTGAAPVVDVQTSRQQRTLPQTEVEALPVSSIGLQTLASVTPGFLGAGADVGGTRDTWSAQGQYRDYHGKDGTRAAFNGFRNQYFIGSAGGAGYLTNSDTIGELQLEITGMGAESGSGSTSLNAIPRDGSNTFQFGVNGKFSNSGMQADNITGDSELEALGLTAGKVQRIYRLAGTAGGPFVQDKFWFYAAVGRWGTRSTVPGAFFNARQGETADFTRYHEFDTSRPADDFAWMRTHSLRLTYQASERNRLAFFGDVQKNCRCTTGFNGSNAIEYENGWDYWPSGVLQGTWTSPVTSRLLLEAGAAWNTINWVNFNGTGVRDRIDRNIRNTQQGFNYGAPFSNVAPTARNGRSEQYFNINYVTGSHNFKVGFSDQQGFNDESREVTGPLPAVGYLVTGPLNDPIPSGINYLAQPFFQQERGNHEIGIFAQDAWTLDRLTLNVGIRYDYLTLGYPAASLEAGPFVPARSVEELTGVPEWSDINPRLGGSYDLFGTGRTAVKVSLGRYNELSRSDFTRIFHPFTSSVNAANRTWSDTNGDFVPDCDLANFATNGECGPISNQNFGQARTDVIRSGDALGVPNNLYSNDILTDNRVYLWDFLAEVQHEVVNGVSIGVGYNRNWAGAFRVRDNTSVEPEDFDEYCVPVPNDPFFGSRAGTQQCGYYDISKELFGVSNNLNTTASNYGDQSKVWNGFVFSVDGRFANGATLAGGLDMGHQVQDFCYTIDRPNAPFNERGSSFVTGSDQSPFCRVERSWGNLTDFRIRGSYPLPANFNFAWIWRDQPGAAVDAEIRVNNADITFVDPARTDPFNGASVTVKINEPLTLFTDRLRQLDLRFTRRFNLQGVRLDTSIDLYNALNGNPVLGANNRIGSNFLRPTSVLGARLLQLYAQLSF